MSNEALLNRINQKREKLLEIAKRNGVSSKQTLECSQELDELIVYYQRLKNNKS